MSPFVTRAFLITPTAQFIGLPEAEKQARYGILNIGNLALGQQKPKECHGFRSSLPLDTRKIGWGYKVVYRAQEHAEFHKAQIDAINAAEWFKITMRDLTSGFSLEGSVPMGRPIPVGDNAAPFGGSFIEK